MLYFSLKFLLFSHNAVRYISSDYLQSIFIIHIDSYLYMKKYYAQNNDCEKNINIIKHYLQILATKLYTMHKI